jgi:phosphoserine phosphatase RsbU/P
MDSANICQIPLFSCLPATEMSCLASRLRCIDIAPGVVFLREGDRGDAFYVILEGRVEIIKALGTAEERLLGNRGDGDFVGEMSLIGTDHLRTASVRTCSQVRLLEMTRNDFDALLHRYPNIAYQLARVLSSTLRDTNDATIRDLQEKNRLLAKAYEDLQAAQGQIIEKEKLERELQLAREIQESMLPHSLPQLAGIELAVRMIPARMVGGDFYDFVALDDNRLGIAVGDVSDKGVPAALFMAMTRSLMRSEARRAASPLEALRWVDRNLQEMNEAEMFVTVLYGVLSSDTNCFHYVRAGHVLPILCQADGCLVTIATDTGQPLGVIPDAHFDEQSIQLIPGSTLILYTDGIIDAANVDGELFGTQRLQRTILAWHHEPVDALCNHLLNAVLDHAGTAPQQDDMTLVVVRFIGQL